MPGPVINGYAFCDPAHQQEIRSAALSWVERNPYQVLLIPRLPMKPGDPSANLVINIAAIKASAAKERDYLSRPENLDNLRTTRARNDADEKYCWR